ncbi:MAG: Rho termination factor N-terminal domain-containing protein, partial [Frankiaceae bacterium]|nr:Rho termination factor N-terminal domain-containing protein [Frankiaceae bacterium]
MSETHDAEAGAATLTAADDSAPSTSASSGENGAKRRTGGLSGKLLPELQQIAGDLGISGAAKLRKGQLIEAI